MRRTSAELIDLYALGITSHEIQVIECSAITGAGLQEGLDWLADRILNKQRFLSSAKMIQPKNSNGEE